ncbi:hypothetical protein CF319_g4304 [Tilletia indica]|nr:hypothetical protein CF319_g4304 [Tilletia indica]
MSAAAAAAAAAVGAGPSHSNMVRTARQDTVSPGLADSRASVPAGAAYAARCWQTLDDMRTGGQKSGHGLRLPRQDRLKRRALGDQIRTTGFQYMRPLEGHISCINTLAFSKDGRWLASGGDDMRVQIRDMYEDIDSERSDVFVTLPGHRANIFTISWSCDGQHLFSGGMDGRVYQYDVETLSNLAKQPRISLEPRQTRRSLWARQPSIQPSALLSAPVNPTGLEFLLGTTPAIREVSAHPYNPSLLLACTQNGLLTLNDTRLPAPGIVGRARLSPRTGLFALSGRSFSGVQFRPLASDGHTFAACISAASNKLDAANVNLKAGTRLYDARMCFSSSSSGSGSRGGGMDFMNAGSDSSSLETASILDDNNAVVLYDSVLERFERKSDEEVRAYFAVADGLNVRFDPTGQFLVSDATGFKPIIYEVGQPQPIAVCEADGYSTRCTTKHGSFGRFGTAWEDWADQTKVADSGLLQDAFDELGPAARELSSLPKIERDGLYYVTGSDDGRGYGWAIPSVQSLVSRREAVEELSILRGERPIDGLYFVSKNGAPLWVPRLRKPAFTLEGAQSITNTTLAHPHLPLIATSGIERLVRMYSPLPFSVHDELPEDGSLSVPLLRPGPTRKMGKKPIAPEGADDERDSIFIAETLLSHQPVDGSDSLRTNERLLRTRQLCREGDLKDISTIAQFDEYLLDEEKDRREKRVRLALAALGESRGSKKKNLQKMQEGDELFRAKPDILYSLRRVFDQAQQGKGKKDSGGGDGSPFPSSSAMSKNGSRSTDGGAGSGSGSSSRGFNLRPPKAKRPWRRSANRPVITAAGEEEASPSDLTEQAGADIEDGGAHAQDRVLHRPGEEEDTEEDGILTTTTDESNEVHHSESDDENGQEDPDHDARSTSQNWVLRAARRLGLQQLSTYKPAKLAGGVWEVRHNSTEAGSDERGSHSGAQRSGGAQFADWEDNDDDAGEDYAEEEVESDDEDEDEVDGNGMEMAMNDAAGNGAEGAARAAGEDDGMTEYERWVRLQLARGWLRNDDMDMDEDEEDDEEEDDDEEEMWLEEGQDGSEDEDEDDDSGAVAYRRLGRERP